MILNTSDLILHFVDKYILEREKNIILQQKIEQQNYRVQDNNKVKTDQQYLVVEWIRGPLYIFAIKKYVDSWSTYRYDLNTSDIQSSFIMIK